MTLNDFLARFAQVREERDGWVVTCPAHDDKHPSLRVAVSTSGKVLLKCRAGCATDAVIDALGMTWADLDDMEVGDVTVRATSTDKPASPAEVAALQAQLNRYAERLRSDPVAHFALTYAENRFGLTPDDVVRLGLGYADDLGGGPRLVVPFCDKDGVARGFQARALDPTTKVRWLGAKSPNGAAWAKVGWLPGVAGWVEVVVTEGPSDGLTACAVGYDVIIVRGASLAATVADDVAAMADGRPVVICGDADKAGDQFARTLAAELARRGLSTRKVRPPRDGDDLTDWRARDPHGFPEAFIRAVQSAQDPGGLRTRVEAWTDADLTEVAAARRLRAYLEEHGSGVRYSPEVGFFILRDGVWRHDKLDEVRTHAQEVAESIWAEVDELTSALDAIESSGDPAGETKELRRRINDLRQFARRVTSSRGLDAMVRELQALPGVATDVNAFDRHPHLLACRNGVVDLRTGKLLPHDPGYLLTRRINLDYDPDAPAPRWRQFLREVFPSHPDLPDYMQRLIGYGITGETTEQCFVVLWGTGKNGKSVFTDTITEVFREITTTTPFNTFEERQHGGVPNDLAALKGARLVMAAEGERGRPMAEAVLKRVTGRDLISARFMRKEYFEFRPTFLLMLATNYKPQFRGQDEGLWRRVKLVPWLRYFTDEERDNRLGEKLLREAQGILAWAVRGAVEWYRDGLQDPPAIIEATREYRRTSDALAGFIPGVFVPDPNSKISVKQVWEAYKTWVEDEGLPLKERWTRKALLAALEERGFPQTARSNQGHMIRGLRRAHPSDVIDSTPIKLPETRADTDPLAQKRNAITAPDLGDIFGGHS